MFVHPVHPSLSSVEEANEPNGKRTLKDDDVLFMIGLVSEGRFRKDVASLPLNVIAIIIVFLAGLLTWPFLRLILSHRQSRLTWLDGHALTYSLIFATVLVTLLLINVPHYLWMIDQFDAAAKAIAADIKKDFKDELTSELEQIDRQISKVIQVGLHNVKSV